MQHFIWVTLILLVIVCIIPYKPVESFKNALDPEYTVTNCYEYITNELGWNISHNLDKYLPSKVEDPKLYEDEKQRLLAKRKELIQSFDAVKHRSSGTLSNQYAYTQACAVKPERMPNNLRNNGQCLISGNVLTRDLVNDGINSGKRVTKIQEHQLETFPNYVKSTERGLENEYEPSEGCFVHANNKDDFFDTMTGLTQINMYPNELLLNSTMVELNKQKKTNINMKKMATLYGINIDQDLDTSIESKCTTYETNFEDAGGFKYNYLDKHDVRCPGDQLLSSFKVVQPSNDYRQKYVYTCCKPQTYDTCIRPVVSQQKVTNDVATTEFNNPWEMNAELQCTNGYLNSMKLQAGYNPNKSSYVYNCGIVDKQYNTGGCPPDNQKDDKRQINFFCEQKRTAMVPKNGGTSRLAQLHVDCGKSAIRDLKLVESGNNYGYQYTCCMPRVDL